MNVSDLRVVFATYRGYLRALSGVTFSLEKGEWLGLVGETGCGKSVTAYSILGLLPPSARVTGGKVLFKGEDLKAAGESALSRIRGRQIAMVFQDPSGSLNPALTVGTQLVETLTYHRVVSNKDALGRAAELLRMVEIQDPRRCLRSYPHELSGGMQQRVVIALALACNPELLIADEPTTNLDVTVQSEILKLLLELGRNRGLGVLLITHNLGIVAHSCDRVAVMYAGRIAEIGPVRVVLQSPAHPYTRGLLRSLPSVAKRSERLESIPGSVPDLITPPEGCYFAERCRDRLVGICSEQAPPLVEVESEHLVACHSVA